jgi:protein-S-isoprenylcysteine O-methyltransferase Ste14
MSGAPDEDREPSLIAPTLGTVLFVILVPGTVIGWVPWRLSGWELAPPLLGVELMRWLGALLLLAALPVFVDFLVRCVRDGRGTPAPVAAPSRLVVSGTFRWVRNPAYVAVTAMLVGHALLFGSLSVLVYAASMGLVFHLFVILWEEPHLRAKFGAEYADYCADVPRWLPSRPRGSPDA